MLVNFLKNSFNINKKSGRNNSGKIVCYRRKNFKLKKKFKLVDLKRFFSFSNFRVLKLLIDVKKTSFLALIYCCNFGLFSYILCSQNLKIGALVSNFYFLSNKKIPLNFNSFDNSCLLINMPLGSKVFNVSLAQFGCGKLSRAAGTFVSLFRKIKLLNKKEFIGLRLPSGLIMYISGFNVATFGISSNIKQNSVVGLGAKNLKKLRRRPRVRGVAMNPVDHPHGGGEGKTSGGRISVSRWGVLAKGGKTISLKKKVKRLKLLKKLKFSVLSISDL